MMQADRMALAENGRESFVFQPTTKAPPHSLPPSLSLPLRCSVIPAPLPLLWAELAEIALVVKSQYVS